MLFTKKIGKLSSFETKNHSVEYILLEWFETRKRILRKKTTCNREVLIKFLNENPELTEGDVLYTDESTIIAVSILPCDCIVLQPANIFEIASVCYEIGNRHLPLFYEEDRLMVPFEMPLYNLLSAQGYTIKQEKRKLLRPLKTTVSPHSIDIGNKVFSKMNKLSTSPE